MDSNVSYTEVKGQLRDHEKRIVALEKTDAEFAIRFENLLKRLDELMGWLKAFVVGIFTASIGFMIWYLQSLPR